MCINFLIVWGLFYIGGIDMYGIVDNWMVELFFNVLFILIYFMVVVVVVVIFVIFILFVVVYYLW